jgi:glycosyltransferase involved in cell wall biosynthesis
MHVPNRTLLITDLLFAMDLKNTPVSPDFSIIIPSYNRPTQLAACLEAVILLDYPRNRYEVIVVDDGSEPPLIPLLESYLDRLPVRLLVQQNSGPAAARNNGAATARGRFLIFTDDDCRPAPDWLAALARHYRQYPVPRHAVTGKTNNGLHANIYSTASQRLIDYLYAYYNADADRARFLTSNNLAMPVECFHEAGGFNTAFHRAAGEDRDFTERLLERGGQLRYDPEVILQHNHPLAFISFLNQHFNYGRAAFCFHRLRAVRKKARITFEPFSFYINLVRYPYTHPGSQAGSMTLAVLLAVTQLVNAAGFAWESIIRSVSGWRNAS